MSGETHPVSELGDRIREARLAKGLGQRSLAAVSGVSQGHISHAESGKRLELGQTVLSAIAEALDVSVDWLATGNGPRERRNEPGAEPELGAVDAARAMFLAQETHDGRGTEARAFLAERAVSFAGAERKSPRWWVETLTEEFREWREKKGDALPKLNPRRAR